MNAFWLVSIIIFITTTFLLSKVTLKKYQTEIGEKMWKSYGSRTYYWKLLLLISFGITALIVFVLKMVI